MTDVEELRGLLAKATPGPWTARIWQHPGKADTVCVKDSREREIIGWNGFDGVPCTKAEIKANARLVAAAKRALPALLAELESLRERFSELERRAANSIQWAGGQPPHVCRSEGVHGNG